MARLSHLLSEKIERRVSLLHLDPILEKLAEELTKSEQEKLAEAYIDLCMLSCSLNETPRTIFNGDHWKLLNIVFMGKVAEFRLIVEGIQEKNEKVDCFPLVKALDAIITQ